MVGAACESDAGKASLMVLYSHVLRERQNEHSPDMPFFFNVLRRCVEAKMMCGAELMCERGAARKGEVTVTLGRTQRGAGRAMTVETWFGRNSIPTTLGHIFRSGSRLTHLRRGLGKR